MHISTSIRSTSYVSTQINGTMNRIPVYFLSAKSVSELLYFVYYMIIDAKIDYIKQCVLQHMINKNKTSCTLDEQQNREIIGNMPPPLFMVHCP